MAKRFWANIFIGIFCVLGLLTGWAHIPFFYKAADTCAHLFLKLLQLISLPLIFLAVLSTITGIKNLQEMKQMGKRVFIYTLGTTLIAAATALLLFHLLSPNKGFSLEAAPAESLPLSKVSYFSFLSNVIPSNFIQAFAENNVIGVVFMAIFFGIASLYLPDKQKEVIHYFFSGLFSGLLKVTEFILKLMPIAIWAFMTLLVHHCYENFSHIKGLFFYFLCIVGANCIQGAIILPLFLKIKKISPVKAFRGMAPALILAFFAKSSNAALPVTLRSAEKNLRVCPKVANFSIPLCSVINMNGCAAFILTTVLFVSTHEGVTFNLLEHIGWIFLATLAAIGNAGVPMGCFFLSSAFLIGMNVPLYLMGLILPFYTILDMLETALNVWSDSCVTLALDKDLQSLSEPLESKEIAS